MLSALTMGSCLVADPLCIATAGSLPILAQVGLAAHHQRRKVKSHRHATDCGCRATQHRNMLPEGSQVAAALCGRSCLVAVVEIDGYGMAARPEATSDQAKIQH